MPLSSALPSLRLYAPGIPPKRTAWLLLLWRPDYVGSLLVLVGSCFGWLPGPALCECCWLLFTGAWSQAVVGRTVGDPRASAGFLVGGVRVPKTAELLLTHWQVKQGPGVIVKLLAGTDVSCSLPAGPRNLRTHFRYFGGWGWFLTHLDTVPMLS